MYIHTVRSYGLKPPDIHTLYPHLVALHIQDEFTHGRQFRVLIAAPLPTCSSTGCLSVIDADACSYMAPVESDNCTV